MRERIQYYDFLRGIAIIAVITIHANGIGYKIDIVNFNFIVSAIIRQIVNFGVPLFLAISGYFLAKKDVSTIDKYVVFLQKQLPRVLIPVLIWSLFYTLLGFKQGVSIPSLLLRFITFQASVPFYYILLIIQFYVLLPVFQRIGTTQNRLFFSLFISIFCCIIIFYIRYYTSISLPLVLYAGNCITWMVFFVLGIYLRNNEIKISKIILAVICLVALLFSVFETWMTYKNYGQITDSVTAVKFSSFLYSFIIILLFSFSTKKKINFLAYVGTLSFGIYFFHMFVLSLSQVIVGWALDSHYIFTQFIIIVITALICVITGFFLNKINKRLVSKYLGF